MIKPLSPNSALLLKNFLRVLCCLMLATLISCESTPDILPELINPGTQLHQLGQTVELSIATSSSQSTRSTQLIYSSEGMPEGLSIQQSSGIISGQANVAGRFTPTISLGNSRSSTETSFTWIINTAPQILNPGDQSHELGEAINLTILANDDDNDALTFSATGLPNGLKLEPLSGLISGQPTVVGVFSAIVRVSDSHNAHAEVQFDWQIRDTATPDPDPTPDPTPDPDPTPPPPTTFSLAVSKAGTGSGTVSSTPAGISCGSTCSATFAEDSQVSLGATASSGSSFAGWSGACSGTGTCTVSMTAARTVSATFNLLPPPPPPAIYSLTVSKAGTGSGTVSSTPSGISCGSSCSAGFPENTSVTLAASATSGSSFAGWSGACSGTGSCTVSMSQARAVTATFNPTAAPPPPPPASYTLTINKSGTGSGTVTSSPSGISCGSACSHNYTDGTSVTLTAVASSGSSFAGWSGACSGTGTCTVSMTAARTITATFNLLPAPNRPPQLSNPGPQTHQVGTSISLSLSATDPDGDNLIFSGNNLPPGLNLNSATGVISGTASTVGTYSVTLSVSDGRGGSDSQTFTWQINPAHSLDPALVGWWTFDEGSGNQAFDSSGKNNTANILNGGWGPGRIGNALHMDGGDDGIVEIPMSASLRTTANEITIMAWAYRTAEHNSAIMAQTYPSLFFGFHAPEQFKWGLVNSSGFRSECYADRRHAAKLYTWYHITGTYDGAMIRLYVDGEEICNVPQTGPRRMPEAPMTISGYIHRSGQLIDEITGMIDDVRVYNRALSPSEIRSIYQQFP